MGHEHPAISVGNSIRQEKYKCFLKGKWKGKEIIVMPAFNPLTEGTNVLEGKCLSPFLQGNLDTFEVFVPAGKDVLSFGKIRNLRER